MSAAGAGVPLEVGQGVGLHPQTSLDAVLKGGAARAWNVEAVGTGEVEAEAEKSPGGTVKAPAGVAAEAGRGAARRGAKSAGKEMKVTKEEETVALLPNVLEPWKMSWSARNVSFVS